jgi:hypothetical protein
LYQALHIAKHGFAVSLRHFCDIAAILARYHGAIDGGIDWSHVKREAVRWHFTKPLYLALCLTQEFFEGAPAEIVELFRPSTVNHKIVETARERVLSYGRLPVVTDRFPLSATEQGHEQALRPLRRLLLSPEMMASHYNLPPRSWRVYFYYPLHLFSLLYHEPRFIKHLVRRDPALISWAQQNNQLEVLRKWLAA